jgi:hypothetical protein
MGELHIPPDDVPSTPGVTCRKSMMISSFKNKLPIEANGKTIHSVHGSLAVEFTLLKRANYRHLCQLNLNNTDEPENTEQEFSSHWEIRPRLH